MEGYGGCRGGVESEGEEEEGVRVMSGKGDRIGFRVGVGGRKKGLGGRRMGVGVVTSNGEGYWRVKWYKGLEWVER